MNLLLICSSSHSALYKIMSILICLHDTPCIFSCWCFSASNSSSHATHLCNNYLPVLFDSSSFTLHCLSALLLGPSHWRKTLLVPIPCSKAFDSSQLSTRWNGLFLACHSGPSTIWCSYLANLFSLISFYELDDPANLTLLQTLWLLCFHSCGFIFLE